MKMRTKRIFSMILMVVIMCIMFTISVSATQKAYTLSSRDTEVYNNTVLTDAYDTMHKSNELTTIINSNRKVFYTIYGMHTVPVTLKPDMVVDICGRKGINGRHIQMLQCYNKCKQKDKVTEIGAG